MVSAREERASVAVRCCAEQRKRDEEAEKYLGIPSSSDPGQKSLVFPETQDDLLLHSRLLATGLWYGDFHWSAAELEIVIN